MSKNQLSLLHIFMAKPAHSYVIFSTSKLLILCLPKRCTLVDNPIHIKETNQHVFTLDCISYILNLVEFVSFHLLNLNHSVKNHPQLQLWIETIGLKSHISNCLFDPLWANEVWILQKPVLLSNLLVSVSINSNDCMANLKISLTCWRTVWNGSTTTVSAVFL